MAPKNGLMLDQDHETLIKLRGARYKSYAEKFVPPIGLADNTWGMHLISALFCVTTFR